MVTNYKYLKNSNTGELIKKQWFTETSIKGMPIYYYDIYGIQIHDPDLTGFVEISEKKFKREKRKLTKP